MSSEWIQHDGSAIPVPADTVVEVMWTSGEVFPGKRADVWAWDIPLDGPDARESPSGVISAYRIVSKETQEA